MAKARTRTRAKRKDRNQSTSFSPLLIGAVVVGALLLVGGLIWLGNQGSQVSGEVELSQFPAVGNENAPVTMVEFSDYGCPHCRDYILDKFEQLEADYIDTGQVRYIVHSFNLGRPETALAAEAAWCAQDQGQFFEYQRALFENQGSIPLNQGALTALAGQLDLDQSAFGDCLSSRTHQADVENARRAASRQGINSTPTFFINDRRIEGNQPYDVFQRAIEQELASAQ